MLALENPLLLAGGHMRIDLGRCDGAMPQELLNVADIHVFLQQECSKGMAEHMRRNVDGNAGQLCISCDHIPHRLLGQFCISQIDEKISAFYNFTVKCFLIAADCFQHIIISYM